jgi:hypothetical protein
MSSFEIIALVSIGVVATAELAHAFLLRRLSVSRNPTLICVIKSRTSSDKIM